MCGIAHCSIGGLGFTTCKRRERWYSGTLALLVLVTSCSKTGTGQSGRTVVLLYMVDWTTYHPALPSALSITYVEGDGTQKTVIADSLPWVWREKFTLPATVSLSVTGSAGTTATCSISAPTTDNPPPPALLNPLSGTVDKQAWSCVVSPYTIS